MWFQCIQILNGMVIMTSLDCVRYIVIYLAMLLCTGVMSPPTHALERSLNADSPPPNLARD